MCKFINSVFSISFIITTIAFTFIPESIFDYNFLECDFPKESRIIFNRVLTYIILLIIVSIVQAVRIFTRKYVIISDKEFKIKVEYGDIFKMNNCKKVINFDECFTTKVGENPADIKPTSVCGQFLSKINISDVEEAIEKSNLQSYSSAHQNRKCYESGRIVRYNDFLLLAFAKLDKNGNGHMSREQYLQCLNVLWEEIEHNYGDHDVAITVLGAGITRFNGASLSQQELVNTIIASYKFSSYHIKKVLHIVCSKSDDFSLNKVIDCI
jgi:hypothetical protein